MENDSDKGYFDERGELISRRSFIPLSFFALFCHPPLSLPKLLKTPTISYFVSSLLLYKILSYSCLPPSLCSILFLHSLFSLPLFFSPTSFLLVARLLLLSVLFNFMPGFLSASAQSHKVSLSN